MSHHGFHLAVYVCDPVPLVNGERLVGVVEPGDVLDPGEPDGDGIGVEEEAAEQEQGDHEGRGEGQGKLGGKRIEIM